MSNFESDANLEDVTDTIEVGPTFPTASNEVSTSPVLQESPTFPETETDANGNNVADNDIVSSVEDETDADVLEDDADVLEDDADVLEDDVGDDEDDVGDDEDDVGDDEDDVGDDDVSSDGSGTGNIVSSEILPEPFGDDAEDDDTEDEDDDYLQKLDKEVRENFLADYHPESQSHNYEEVKSLAKVTRNKDGQVIDALHRTLPFLTKYERTRILGQRAKQIDTGAKSFVKTDNNILDGYIIAQAELEQKKIPFIIKRPLPNGGFEYWNISDLELIH
jgi:DNA-directed RNA polymerase I, II, and III subunit RPABC2